MHIYSNAGFTGSGALTLAKWLGFSLGWPRIVLSNKVGVHTPTPQEGTEIGAASCESHLGVPLITSHFQGENLATFSRKGGW